MVINSLTLLGPHFFCYCTDGGGGGDSPFNSTENWQVDYSICTYTSTLFKTRHIICEKTTQMVQGVPDIEKLF